MDPGAIHYRNGIKEGEEADSQKIEEFMERYEKILEKAKEEYEYEPPGEYFKDGYNLYQRMSKDKEDYLLFLQDLTIPPDNNAAENAARKYKRKNARQCASEVKRAGITFVMAYLRPKTGTV